MSNFPPPPGPPFEPGQPGNPQGTNENNPFGNSNNPPPPPNPYAPPGSNTPPPPPNPYTPPGSNMPPPQNPYTPPGSNMPPPQNPYGNTPPPPQNPYNQPPGGFPPPNNPYGGTMPPPMFGSQRTLPNSVGVLVLGICSIVFCWCYGIVGLICGIIAMVLASKAKRLYEATPGDFTVSSFKNMNAGRICAIIGLILSGLYLIYVIFLFATIGTAMMGGFGALNGFNNY